MLKFSNILMAAVVVMMAMAPAFAQDNKQETEAKEVKTQVELFARTGMEPVPFRLERSEDADTTGYFPAETVIQIVYWGNPWVMLHFAGAVGWVKKSDITEILTPDGQTWARKK